MFVHDVHQVMGLLPNFAHNLDTVCTLNIKESDYLYPCTHNNAIPVMCQLVKAQHLLHS